MKKFNIAVVGATGNVGREIVNTLFERNFPVDNLKLFASSASINKEVSYGEKHIKVEDLANADFTNIDIIFASPGSRVSKDFAPKAAKQGAIIIDNSSYFRMDDEIPLIVPEVNIDQLNKYNNKNIIANPNCCVIPLTVALKPLDNIAKIKRIILSTYQSTSGAGKRAMDELYSQTKNIYVFQEAEPEFFDKKIAFNVLPQIGELNDNFDSDEEVKIMQEAKKILGTHINISATCVRVPTFIGHCLSVNVEFEKELSASEAEEILSEFPEISVINNQSEFKHATPDDVAGDEQVYVSRIRKDQSKQNCLNMWITCDNLRKGAALNAVQIGEELLKIIDKC